MTAAGSCCAVVCFALHLKPALCLGARRLAVLGFAMLQASCLHDRIIRRLMLALLWGGGGIGKVGTPFVLVGREEKLPCGCSCGLCLVNYGCSTFRDGPGERYRQGRPGVAEVCWLQLKVLTGQQVCVGRENVIGMLCVEAALAMVEGGVCLTR